MELAVEPRQPPAPNSGQPADGCGVGEAAGFDPAAVELVRQAGAGSREAFAELVHRFSPRVFSYLHRMTGHHHDAQDLTQDTFLKAFHSLHRLQQPAAFPGWIFIIARRTALNHFRGSRPTEELPPEHGFDGPDPAAQAVEQDDRGSLWQAARALKPRHYEVLWLHYAEGLSIAETARVMRLGRIHVRVLLHRARIQLAERLERPPGCSSFQTLSPRRPL